jgi:signal transduction histidine kinase/ligand-binding sensor domain-containing protein
MTRRRFLRWLGGAFALCAALVQSAHAERLPVRIFTSADGLGSSFVDYLMRDSHGFLWFCTRDGLSRFDGSRFTTYQIGEKNAPAGIEAIYETRRGDYWVTTTSGTYRFHSDTVAHSNTAGGSARAVLPAEFVWPNRAVIFEDSHGQMWSGGNGLFRIQENGGKFALAEVPLNLPSVKTGFLLTQIEEASDGSLWLNTTEGPIRRLPDGRVVLYRVVPKLDIFGLSMLIDFAGRVWFANRLNFVIFKPEAIESFNSSAQFTVRDLTQTPTVPSRTGMPVRLPAQPGETLHLTGGDFLTENVTQQLFQSADAHIWLTTEKALVEFDGAVFHQYAQNQGMLRGMGLMTEDIAGNIWIGGRNGLVRLDRNSLTTFTEADGLYSGNVHAIAESSDGRLLFADSDYYLSQFSGTELLTHRAPITAGLEPRWTSRNAMFDSPGDLWVLAPDGLYRFGPGNWNHPSTVYTTRDGLKSDAMFQIYEDARGAIWASQFPPNHPENEGLSRLDPGGAQFHTFTIMEGFPDGKAVSSFAEDRAGNLWVGFYEGGLARFTGGRFTVYGEADGVPKGLVTDLYLDSGGRLWITSSNGGCRRIDDPLALTPRLVTIEANDKLSSNNIRTVTGDKLGNIYLGTVRGVDRISADGLRFKHFSVTDGLASDFVVDSHCDRNGVVWFATTNGLSRMVPAVDDARGAPPVWLGGVGIGGVAQPVYELGQTSLDLRELSHNQNTLQVDFFGLDFRAGEQLRYQYKLEGADKDWSPPTEQRTVRLANLQPGTYRFLVRAVNSDGEISVQPAILTFRILPPFWLRWWFIALCVLAVVAVIGAAIVAVYSYRTARLRQLNATRADRIAELERVRNRIATDLHDDIGASLTQIAVLSEVAQTQNGSGASASNKPLKMISNVSNELVETMSDIVWSINPSKDHLSDLTQRMRRFASDLLTAKGIAIKFSGPDRELEIPLDTSLRREVFLIFKESINNVVKHSGATHVWIDLSISGTELNLEISDDGAGFALDDTQARRSDPGERGGNGILSIQRRARELKGVLAIDTKSGEGTKLSLRVPLEQNIPT